MLKKITLISVVMLCLSGISSLFANPAYIPQSGIVSVKLHHINSDPGVSWLLTSWKNSDRESNLRDFVKTINFDTMGVSVLPSNNSSVREMLLVIEVGGSDYDFNTLRRIIQENPDTPVLEQQFQGNTIYYANNELNDYDAFSVVDGTILIGTSLKAVEQGLGKTSYTETKQYEDASKQISDDKDIIIFADNKNLQFAKFLEPLQDKWRLTLLLSADSLEWIGYSFDVLNSDSISGQIVFKGSNANNLDDVIDDANFIGEAFKRKFMAEKISYTSDVTVNNTYVTLTFESKGLEPLWIRLFEKGVMSVIKPQ